MAKTFKRLRFNPDLPLTMCAVLATAAPRELHRLSRELIGRAVLAGRRQVEQGDLNALGLDAATVATWSVVSAQLDDRATAPGRKLARH